VHSVAAWRVLGEEFPELQPAFVAGHSMGEISALVASGSLDFEKALTLARRRGELMKRAGEINPGGMAAILGLDIPTLETICQQASTSDEIVQVANDNCPGQVVISGATPALERAIALAQSAGARRAVKLAVSIAAHSPLMAHAQADFSPVIPVIGNVHAGPLRTSGDIQADLQAQLGSRVRWTETIRYMQAQGVTHFLEIGSGSVLTGLLKRIDRQATGLSLGTSTDLESLATWG
jgi:[acyl-carrier-protein] S-malonyltransferase